MARLLLAGLAYSFILATGVAQDAPDIISVDVASSNDLVIFMDNIKKDEKRVFNVTWYGRQQVGERITVSSGTNVTITGVTLPGADPAVANDAGIATGMFFVHGGSILSLRNLMLDGGDAEDGAAISVVENGVVNVFDCAFTNNIASNGGAIYVRESEVNIEGHTYFANNSATSDDSDFFSGGGAIYATASTVNIAGNTTFVNNTALLDGGALLLHDGSKGYINGNTGFLNNQAGDDGGGVSMYSDTNLRVDGITIFRNNSASDDGGAIKAEISTVEINGSAFFTGNSAGGSGGAVRVTRGQGLYIEVVDAVFANNSATVGGAIHSGSSELIIDGNITFANNSAVEFGGALYSLEDEPVTLAGGLSFIHNSARTGGGAMSIGDPSELSVVAAIFKLNTANVGGAVSVTAVQEEQRTFHSCIFEDNSAAADGGAMHFFAGGGVDIVSSSTFRSNLAVNSGGAIYHRENIVLANTTFHENRAGDEGLAVLGSTTATLHNVSFANNTFYCAFGQYLYDETFGAEGTSNTTRFNHACAKCSTEEGNRKPDGVDVQYPNKIPTCEDIPTGGEHVSPGTTVQSLTLEPGYFRASDQSRKILECHHQSACVGGSDTVRYCDSGYEGPYCAVCAEDFAPWMAYRCRRCSAAYRRSALGFAIAMLLVLVVAAAALSAHLIRLIGSGDENDTEITRSSLDNRCIRVENVIVKIFPLTAFKIVVVVWQIISQFASIAGDVYPEEYATFVSKLSFINLDIGFMLSSSCLVTTDFYDKLLLSTISPLVVLTVLAGTYSVARNRNLRSEAAMREVQYKHMSTGLFVAFLVYSSVSFTVFQTFVCEDMDDGRSYLRADYSLTCNTGTYAKYRAYAIVMVFVYPIGLPAIIAWWLLRNRADLKQADRTTMEHLQPFSGIWAPYKPSRYFYEVVECGRRIALTATASFVLPNSMAQIAVVLLVAAILLFVSESMSPFRSKLDMGLYRWGNGIILASMYVALLLKVDKSGEDDSTLSAFGKVLIAANVFLVSTVLVQSVLLVVEWRGVTRMARLVHQQHMATFDRQQNFHRRS